MIDTNLLLSIGFSIITNFANVVHLPDNAVPKSPADLQRCLIGSPYSPIDLFLEDRQEKCFEISDGVVCRYSSPDSFFEIQDPKLIPNYTGTSLLTTNDLMGIASVTVQRLVKHGNPVTNGPPKIVYAGFYKGKRIPFFRIIWPNGNGGITDTAVVEIDGRTGQVVFARLWDTAFRDFVFGQKIKDQVYTPEPKKPVLQETISPVRKFHLPQPSTNYVSKAIKNWLVFCNRLGFETGTETNVANVNWDHTWLYTNEEQSARMPVCQIRFVNSSRFESINGIVFSHVSQDACYVGFWDQRPPEEWSRFRGKIVKSWQELAKELEPLLIEKLGIPKELLAPFSPNSRFKAPDVGSEGIKRVIVDWRNWPHNTGRTVWTSETKLAISAEFDLETGELKFIKFHDPKFIEALGKTLAQRK
jgi:hypothetical protein